MLNVWPTYSYHKFRPNFRKYTIHWASGKIPLILTWWIVLKSIDLCQRVGPHTGKLGRCSNLIDIFQMGWNHQLVNVPDALSMFRNFTYRSWQICWMGAYCHWRLAWCDIEKPFSIISSWVPESSLGEWIDRVKLFVLRQSCLTCFNSFLLFFHVFPTWCALRPLPWFHMALWPYGGGDIGRPWLMSQHNGSWASSG